jgi:hypothetical protein
MKHFYLAGLVFLLIFTGIGCSGSDSGSDKEAVTATTEQAVESQADQVAETVAESATDTPDQLETEEIPGQLEAVLSHFRSEGLEVDDVHFKLHEMMGAQKGIGFNLEGGPVELYLFDPADMDSEAMDNLEKAIETGIFFSPGLEKEVAVEINGNIMLTGLEIHGYSHPEKDRIVEIFSNF